MQNIENEIENEIVQNIVNNPAIKQITYGNRNQFWKTESAQWPYGKFLNIHYKPEPNIQQNLPDNYSINSFNSSVDKKFYICEGPTKENIGYSIINYKHQTTFLEIILTQQIDTIVTALDPTDFDSPYNWNYFQDPKTITCNCYPNEYTITSKKNAISEHIDTYELTIKKYVTPPTGSHSDDEDNYTIPIIDEGDEGSDSDDNYTIPTIDENFDFDGENYNPEESEGELSLEKTVTLYHFKIKDFNANGKLNDGEIQILFDIANNGDNNNILTHCNAGVGRSGYLTLAFVTFASLKNQHWQPLELQKNDNKQQVEEKIVKIVKENLMQLRKKRPQTVQTDGQLKAAIKLIMKFLQKYTHDYPETQGVQLINNMMDTIKSSEEEKSSSKHNIFVSHRTCAL